MDKRYFIIKDGEKKGAYTFEELIKLEIFDNDLIWEKDFEDWTKASEIKELQDYLIFSPPPTPSEKKEIKIQKKKEEIQIVFLENSKPFFKYFIIASLVIALVLNFMVYFVAVNQIDSNHSAVYDVNPIYLTKEEIRNPSLIFWNQLPTSLILGAIIGLVGTSIYYYKKNSQ